MADTIHVELPHEKLMKKFKIDYTKMDFKPKKNIPSDDQWQIVLRLIEQEKAEGTITHWILTPDNGEHSCQCFFKEESDRETFLKEYFNKLVHCGGEYLQEQGKDPKEYNISFVLSLREMGTLSIIILMA